MAGKEDGRLTNPFNESIDQPGRYGDGRHGLYLVVKRNADGGLNRVWTQRIRINGKQVTLGLGSYPVVTLAMARAKAFDNARRVA